MAESAVVVSLAPMSAAFSVSATRDAAPTVAACLAALDLGGEAECLSLSPVEWLIVGPLAREAALLALIGQALEGLDADLQCVADAWAAWLLDGTLDAVHALISQGALIDGPAGRPTSHSLTWRGALGPFTVVLRWPPAGSVLEVWVEQAYSEALRTWIRRREGRTAGSSGGGIVSLDSGPPRGSSREGEAGT